MLPGAEWHYTGAGAANLGLGGAVGSGRGTVQDAIINPAALAGSENLLIGASYGTFSASDTWAGLGLSLPEDFGVLTFNLLYGGFHAGTNMSAGDGIIARGSLSKLITPNFHFGAGLGLLFASRSPDAEKRLGANIDLGFILLQNGTLRELAASARERGFGFFDRAFSFSLNNIGLNLSWENWKQYPDARAMSAFGFTFYKSGEISLDTKHEFGLSFDDWSVRYSGGIGFTLYKLFSIRAGLNLGNGDLGPFALGAGLDLRDAFKSFGFDLSWAMIPFDYAGDTRLGHFITLNLIFGPRNQEPPLPDMTSRFRYFSPNNDGVQDTTEFAIRLDGKQEIKRWQIAIRDANSRVVRRLGNDRESERGLTFKKFFVILFSSRVNATIPESWEWDGRDDEGRPLEDGVYSYQIGVEDTLGNEGLSLPKFVDIRTAQPSADISIKLTLFSPNRGGDKDVLVVEQALTGRDTRWTGNMLDANGKTVKTFSWGNNPPARFEWDGKDNGGKTVPDGHYEYVAEGSDSAGNSVRRKFSGILVSTRKRSAGVSVSAEIFAPGGKSPFNQVRFTPVLETSDLFKNWKLQITDPRGAPVKSFEGDTNLPREIAWDGLDDEGKGLADGRYAYSFSAGYADGDRPAAAPRTLRLLTKPPSVQLDASPRLFAPDDSSENKQLRITLQFEENSIISNWQVRVRKGDTIFTSFSGASPKTKTVSFPWDGKGDAGDFVESAASYTLEAGAVDIVGNEGHSAPVLIDIDVLVVKTSRGLQILITSIEFAYNEWALAQEDSPVLNRVSDVLKRYSDYKIIIEGHTDSIGGVDYNLMLSTRRARTVLRYLVKRGIEDRRMLAKGLGLSVPIASNATEEGRAKNRRVEFILVKDEQPD